MVEQDLIRNAPASTNACILRMVQKLGMQHHSKITELFKPEDITPYEDMVALYRLVCLLDKHYDACIIEDNRKWFEQILHKDTLNYIERQYT